MKTAQQKGYPRMGLLNSEGDLLVAYKTPSDYMIMDQWGVCVDILSEDDLKSFIIGEYNITDSKGRIFNYVASEDGMKPSNKKLETFLNKKVKEQE